VEIKKEGQATSGRRDRWWLQHMASRALQQRLFGNISSFTAHFFYPFFSFVILVSPRAFNANNVSSVNGSLNDAK
jgi:hypothetical protein